MKKKLNEVFPEWLTGGGVFNSLQSFPVPWQDESLATALDMEYHGNVSGKKYVSPLVDSIITGDTITNTERALLCASIMAVYGVNWSKTWTTLSLSYNPIENYSMVEEMTNDETVTIYGKTTTRTDNLSHGKTGTETDTPETTETRTDNLSHGKTGTETQGLDTTETRTDNLTHEKDGTETRTDNLTETTEPGTTTNTNNSVFGFNSANSVPTGGQSQTVSGTDETTHTGTQTNAIDIMETDTGTQTTLTDGENVLTYDTTDTDTGTQTTTRTGTDTHTYNTMDTETGTQTIGDTGTDSNTRNYTLTRSGNIGVTTSQQMIESERKLWVWNFFRNVVFPDIDKMLTLQIY